jgi:phenylpyruvate tautomerase PptA (4-oxalocrotonate tautomerase family)
MPTVIVYWSPGRTAEQKKRVSQRIYDALVEDGHARSEDVLVIFQNIEAGDASRPGTTGTVSAPNLTPDQSNKDKE